MIGVKQFILINILKLYREPLDNKNITSKVIDKKIKYLPNWNTF